MKIRSLLLAGFLLLAAVVASARTFPPVVLSADLDRRPTYTAKPQHYILYIAPYVELGSVAAGSRRPPDQATLARLIQAALPSDQFMPIASSTETPDIVLGVHWGEVSPEGPQPLLRAREGGVIRAIWAITVGRTHVPPFLMPSERSNLDGELSRDHFFLLISAYDPAALRNGKVAIRWQTRTSIDSIQVRADEAWGYLAGVAKNHLAQRIERPNFVADAPKLSPVDDTNPLVGIDEVIPGVRKLLTFEKAMPPY